MGALVRFIGDFCVPCERNITQLILSRHESSSTLKFKGIDVFLFVHTNKFSRKILEARYTLFARICISVFKGTCLRQPPAASCNKLTFAERSLCHTQVIHAGFTVSFSQFTSTGRRLPAACQFAYAHDICIISFLLACREVISRQHLASPHALS